VNFDLGEVLARAWQIAWKNKSLWWFGVFLSLGLLVIFPLMLAPISFPILLQDRRMDLILAGIVGFVLILFLFFAILYLVSAVLQTALTLGTLRAIQVEERIPLIELIKESLPFLWRVLGVMLLYATAVTIVNLVLQAIIFLLIIGTFGLGMLCATPLTFLMYPAIYIAIAWMEQTINGVVIDKMTVMDAIKQGWQIIRNNLMAVSLVIVVVYFGIGVASTVVVIPMMAPFLVIPFSFLEGDPNWTILSISLLCGAVFVPLFALISGWSAAFTKSVWVLTYLRLTRGSAPQPELLEATS